MRFASGFVQSPVRKFANFFAHEINSSVDWVNIYLSEELTFKKEPCMHVKLLCIKQLTALETATSLLSFSVFE